MSSHSGGPTGSSCCSSRDKRTRTESSYALEGDWEDEPPSPSGPSLLPFSIPMLSPEWEVPQLDNLLTIELTASCLVDMLHSVEGSSFGFASKQLEVLLEMLCTFFYPELAHMVGFMDHVLLYAPSVPDPPAGICIVAPCVLETSPAPPAPLASSHVVPLI
ncbi:hypothetical protein AX15_003722 [Amanita polypyramis BW_CC]|nr:hypothetical protein AX15_003722 [Amanita polypyramis BW_CC]